MPFTQILHTETKICPQGIGTPEMDLIPGLNSAIVEVKSSYCHMYPPCTIKLFLCLSIMNTV